MLTDIIFQCIYHTSKLTYSSSIINSLFFSYANDSCFNSSLCSLNHSINNLSGWGSSVSDVNMVINTSSKSILIRYL